MKNQFFPKNFSYKQQNYFVNVLYSFIVFVLSLFSVFFIGFSFVYIGNVPVEGVSMQPTLNESGRYKSDIIYINKFANYTRGDIIVIRQNNSSTDHIIKRVIGMEGDVINIALNTYTNEVELYINGILQVEDYIFDVETAIEPNDGMFATLENFNNLKDPSSSTYKPELFNSNGFLVVPQNTVFVLGDNRGFSSDSATKGPFPTEWVVGRVDFVVPYGESQLTYFLNYFTPFNF